jgi:quercetin dioxygenase-like cupin family protein
VAREAKFFAATITCAGRKSREVGLGVRIGADLGGAMSGEELAPGLRRTVLQREDLSAAGREVVQARVEVAPGAALVKHTHPGEEVIYVLEGLLEFYVEGQPMRTYHAGGALTVPAGVVHGVRNVGADDGVELSTYVVEKSEPLLTFVDE